MKFHGKTHNQHSKVKVPIHRSPHAVMGQTAKKIQVFTQKLTNLVASTPVNNVRPDRNTWLSRLAVFSNVFPTHLEASLHLSQVELRSIPELRSASTLLSERQARAKQLVIKKQIKSPMSHPKATICLVWVETTTLFKASKSR